MKILHVTRELGSESRFGLGRSVQQLIDGQRGLGLDVSKLCADQLGEKDLRQAAQRAAAWGRWTLSDGLPIWPVVSQAMAVGELAATLVRTEHFTHVHCHDAVVAAGLCRGLGAHRVRWGVTLHGFDTVGESLHSHFTALPAWLRWWLRRAERNTLGSADWVIALTRLGANQIEGRLRTSTAARWHVVPHARPDWTPPDRESARAALGWTADQQYLLAVGQLVPSKRFDWIIRAMKAAAPGWRLVLLGEGDSAHCVELAASVGIERPLITVTDTPAPFFAAADVYASASATESFGMANLEALHAGLPALCTAVGGVPEVLGDGAMLAPDSEPLFAEHLARLLADEGLQRAMRLRAAKWMRLWPSITDIAERHRAIYTG